METNRVHSGHPAFPSEDASGPGFSLAEQQWPRPWPPRGVPGNWLRDGGPAAFGTPCISSRTCMVSRSPPRFPRSAV